jgi:hypothetical protein
MVENNSGDRATEGLPDVPADNNRVLNDRWFSNLTFFTPGRLTWQILNCHTVCSLFISRRHHTNITALIFRSADGLGGHVIGIAGL